MLDQITSIEKYLSELKDELEFKKQQSFVDKFFNGSLEEKIRTIEKEQADNVHNYLISTNTQYASIVSVNYHLLAAVELKFTVYRSEYAYSKSYTHRMRGRIEKNGYGYYNRDNEKHGGNGISIFANYSYPSEMQGTIDCFGRFRIRTTKLSYSMFKTLPKYLIGEIDHKGCIILRTVERENDFFTGGSMVIDRMICNHFKGRENDRIAFINNRIKLRMMMNGFREKLICE